MTRRWLITGCSTGLGRALAEAVAASGQQVLATARRPETLESLRDTYPKTLATCALDVRDPDTATTPYTPPSPVSAASTSWSTTPDTATSARSRRSPTPSWRPSSPRTSSRRGG
ncbi:SDR family NAD(P)-dependent oxidoreductase [Dactylosporangium cerinum]